MRMSGLGRVLPCLVVVAAWLGPAAGSPLPPTLAAKLDPRLVAAMREGGGDRLTVWVAFADKGEQGPASLASELARAAAALSPRNRARRERAHVWPLVDYRDLPVSEVHLEALRKRGLAPLAVSRWLNRAAVRLEGARLAELAELPFVERIVPVERAMISRDLEAMPETAAPQGKAGGDPDRAPGRGSSARAAGCSGVLGACSIDYGRTFDQVAQLNLPAVHDSGYTGAGVLVCILDDGFNFHDMHEALRDQVILPGRRRDFVDGDTTVTNTASSGQRHGTWVMGCIAGNKPGSYVGTAFGAEYALGRTEDDFNETPVEMLYWGMGAEWADSLGADLITSSLGYFLFNGPGDYTYQDMDGHTTDVTRAAEIAASKGILVVNAVGNEGNTPWRYLIAPSDVDGDSLIAVGAVDAAGDTASFSSSGPSADGRIKPDLVARGVSNPVVSATDSTGYGFLGGTSFATPLISGLAACLMQARPTWTPQQVIQAMRTTASHASSPDNKRGFGIPDALAALGHALVGVPAGHSFFPLALIGPNPLHVGGPPARLRFTLGDQTARSVPSRIRVLDAQGRAVRELWSGALCYGHWTEVQWDGRDRDGRAARAGIYWVTVEGGGRRAAIRLVSLG